MSTISATAIVVKAGKRLAQETVKLPALGPDQLLVEVAVAAQNPTDRGAFDHEMYEEGAVQGCDLSGIVQKIGSEVKSASVGDRVAAVIWGGETKSLGAFATHCYAQDKILFKIPPSISFEQAATVPLAANTAWLALLAETCLNIPRESKASVLIWGGSSSVGLYAIQLSKILGFKVTTTCSPRNFDAVKACGADHIFDYNDPQVVQKIKATDPNIEYVFDTIGAQSQGTSRTSAEAVGDKPGTLCTVRPGKTFTEDVPKNVKVTDVMMFTAFNRELTYRKTMIIPRSQADHDLSAELYAALPEWLEKGLIKPNVVKNLGPLSVENIEKGYEMARKKQVSNEKIVYQVKQH